MGTHIVWKFWLSVHTYTVCGYYLIKLSEREVSQVLEQYLPKFKQRKNWHTIISHKNNKKRFSTNWLNESGFLPPGQERTGFVATGAGSGSAATSTDLVRTLSCYWLLCWQHALPIPRIWLYSEEEQEPGFFPRAGRPEIARHPCSLLPAQWDVLAQ